MKVLLERISEQGAGSGSRKPRPHLTKDVSRGHSVEQAALVSILILLTLPVQADESLTCLPADEDSAGSLYAHLQQDANSALDRRLERLDSVKSPEDVVAYQQRLRQFFVEQLGGFPDRTPLNAQTVGTLQADGYRIENVIFESRPRHHITANLYLPDGDGPFPGVVVSSGHSRTAKTADYNQRFGIMLARHGMAALCFDPIGQGERSQILDETGRNRISGTTTEHQLIGTGSILVGRNTATYRIWDAMRSIDYLVSRPEIDAEKIGMTGCSGGGTLTSYTMALDDRVLCAAPSCYLTTFRRLLATRGPQDAEQNIHAQIAFGLDQPDYVLLRAPRPTLISSTTQDFFDIGGTWENFRQAKQIYGRLGYPERVDLVEIEGDHGVTPQNLATIAYWMQRWLSDRDEPIAAVELQTRPPEDLLCTPGGQVLLLPDELSVFDLNAQYQQTLAQQRQQLNLQDNEFRNRIRDQIGMQSDNAQVVTSRAVGEVQADGYVIQKYVLKTGSGVPLPTLVFRPEGAAGEVCLYLHDRGKSAAAGTGGPIEALVRQGTLVVAVDLSGQGETASGQPDAQLGDWKTFYLAYLLGRSLVGLRVQDTLAATQFAATQFTAQQTPTDNSAADSETSGTSAVKLIAVGQTGIVALHAAALQPDAFSQLTLSDTPSDWASSVGQPMSPVQLDHTVHAALHLYDLPDLIRLAGPDKVRFATSD